VRRGEREGVGATSRPDEQGRAADAQPPNGDGILWSAFATTFRVISRPLRVVAGPSGIDVPRRVEEAAMDAVATPTAQRAIDDVLAGPLPEMVGSSLGRHHVVERVVAEVLASEDLDAAVVSALESERTTQLLRKVLESPALERLLTEAVDSKLTADLTDRVVERVVASPQLREALLGQSTSLAGEAAVAVRARTIRVDAAAERGPRRWLRRAPRPAAEPGAPTPIPYAGVATRGAALAIDVALVALVFLVGAALVGLVASLVGDLRPQWLVGVLMASAWLAVQLVYFAGFWSVVGQTPGMRVLRLRVAHANAPPGLGRSLVRFVGLLLAIVPCFAGFLPVLVDGRRRGLHDFIAGTVVTYEGAETVVTYEGVAPIASPGT